MPSFQRSVLPFCRCRFTVPCRCAVAEVAVACENRIAGNVFPLTAFEVTSSDGQKLTKKLATNSLTNFF